MVQTALGAMKTQLGGVDAGLSAALDNVSTAFGTLSTNVKVDMSAVLSTILSAIQGLPDYGSIVAAINSVVESLGS